MKKKAKPVDVREELTKIVNDLTKQINEKFTAEADAKVKLTSDLNSMFKKVADNFTILDTKLKAMDIAMVSLVELLQDKKTFEPKEYTTKTEVIFNKIEEQQKAKETK